MNYEQILNKKKKNEVLSFEELSFFFNGYINNKIDDDIMTVMLKLICKYGLTDKEIYDLTDIFINSGDTLDLSSFGTVVDKHSTGGVGDKTTLIIAPIIAVSGIKIAKMSGRALGYTGGTIDKLESIKGFNVNLSEEEFKKELQDINMVITSQTANLCPMDKKVYALRDVTNTTSSIALIAVSIMSKKIASGAKFILIDIKVGKGALVKNIKEAKELSSLMIKIGRKYNRTVKCILSGMNNPLGDNIGNALEILEVIDVLNGKQNKLSDLCIYMSSLIISIEKDITFSDAKQEVKNLIESKKALNKFYEFVKYQKGDIKSIKISCTKEEILSPFSGYIKSIDAKKIGMYSMSLGAGRIKKDDKINYEAGIILNKNVGDYIAKGELLCTLYGDKKAPFSVKEIYKHSRFKPKNKNIIIDTI